MALTIAELARGGGVGVETVRYYQRRGLLVDPKPSASGRSSGRRHYGPDEVRQLRFIRSAQCAGFSLSEIAELLALDRSADRPRAREMARARIVQLDAKIAEMQAARQSLARLATECAKSDSGPCPIVSAFENA